MEFFVIWEGGKGKEGGKEGKRKGREGRRETKKKDTYINTTSFEGRKIFWRENILVFPPFFPPLFLSNIILAPLTSLPPSLPLLPSPYIVFHYIYPLLPSFIIIFPLTHSPHIFYLFIYYFPCLLPIPFPTLPLPSFIINFFYIYFPSLSPHFY